jgi:hypothetical protein
MSIALGKVVELTANDDDRDFGDFCVDFEMGRLIAIPQEYREGRIGPSPVF